MDILSYLSALLKTHKEVGIPGLGTIYKRKSPGRYDTETHSFLPPSYSLNFTSDLKEQVLLTDLISKTKNISEDASTYFVESFSEQILDELAQKQEADFGDLGSFSTASGSLTFIPKTDKSFGFEFYGLPVLKDELPTHGEIQEVTRLEELPSTEEVVPSKDRLALENDNADLSDGTEPGDEATELPENTEATLIDHLESTETPFAVEEENNDDQPVYEEISEPIRMAPEKKPSSVFHIETPEGLNEKEQDVFESNSAPVASQFTLDYSQEEKKGLPAYLKISIALATIIAIAGILLLIKPSLFEKSSKEVSKPENVQVVKDIEQLRIDSIAHADSVRKSNEKAILAIDSAKDSLITKPIVEHIDTVISYEIIAASLLNKKEADNFLADMKSRGISAKIVDLPGKRVKISIGSYTDEDTAKQQLEVLKKTTKIPGIYIRPLRHTNNPK